MRRQTTSSNTTGTSACTTLYLALVAFDDDLSRFYLDALKDPLYSGDPAGKRRRSAQSAVFEILRTLAVLLAPLLSFTAEEAWQFVPEALREGIPSVFDLDFPKVSAVDGAALEEWATLKALRAAVSASESPRDFEAGATVLVTLRRCASASRALGDNLREALIVSQIESIGDAPDGTVSVRLQSASRARSAHGAGSSRPTSAGTPSIRRSARTARARCAGSKRSGSGKRWPTRAKSLSPAP